MTSSPTSSRSPFYITTPIYYVNDRPHIGHCYTTLVADVAARAQRLAGREVFFLTGTDEHAEKVVTSAAAHGLSPQEWADLNAQRFREAFGFMNFSNDDFVRTTEDRHKTRASAYIQRLVDSGDIELGDYEGWWDASQEEYLTETTAKENDFKSPVTGKPLEKRIEQNYFFRLDKYEDWLKAQIESGAIRVLPEARKNEVMGRIRQGLNKVPVSRKIKEGDPDWGVVMPNDPGHRVYVWIEALCNYLTTVDTPERRKFWPPADGADNAPAPIVHYMAKDILWFHAVIWPAMLHALGERPPATVYAHAYFIAEGRKMSKSLGNFIEIDTLRAYAERYSLDAVRWFLATQGPLGSNDADFAYARFVEVYNADLANGIGNAVSRVGNMIDKYFGGTVPEPVGDTGPLERALVSAKGGDPVGASGFGLRGKVASSFAGAVGAVEGLRFDEMLRAGIETVGLVDAYINATRPFTVAKAIEDSDAGRAARAIVGTILYECAEALRIASLLLSPAMPEKMMQVWKQWDCVPPAGVPLAEVAEFGGRFALEPGRSIMKGEALFMRADAKEPAPGSE